MYAVIAILLTAIQQLSGDNAFISVNASPPFIPAGGGSTTISATVTDTDDKPIVGIPVSFSTDHGSLNATVADTDQSGIARVFLTTSAVSKVTATAGAAADRGATARPPSAIVTVNISPPPMVAISAST